MFSKLLIAAALLNLSFVPAAFADRMGIDGDKFYEEAGHFVNACRENPCVAPYTQQVIYDYESKMDQLSLDNKNLLQKVAFRQAQIWGDSILEGDYYAEGRTRLDRAVAFYRENELVGYKIQYSEKAWYVGECDFNGNMASLPNCQEGRIIEESYVSSDGKTFFSDEDNYASFF